ncbi:hypothetical protein [uncultured Jatrophihabitans sp.]|uniref:hypothetical protein n=1 Tax=uncultured Jatrophihabitans sp. TaxID=1610747 RepID=UPI0035CB1C5C
MPSDSEPATSEPSQTDFVVIRPADDIVDNPGIASHFDGQWRKRSELADQAFIEFDGANGVVRAYPSQRIETSPAGDRAQVYEVLDGSHRIPR